MDPSRRQIKMSPGMFPEVSYLLHHSFIPSFIFLRLPSLASAPPTSPRFNPKYVSLYRVWHGGIGLSGPGNDFFCSYFSAERDPRGAGYQAIYYPASSPLSCLTKCNLPWFTQLPQDGERKRNNPLTLGHREFKEIHRHLRALPNQAGPSFKCTSVKE